jgi:hypothetical protein
VGAALHSLDPVKTLKKPRELVFGDATASIVDRQYCSAVRHSNLHRDATLKRVFEGVGDQVENDLLPHIPINIDGLGEGRAVYRKGEPGFFTGRPKIARELRG